MNAIDIVILIPFLWGFIRGFMKGAIMEAATFVAFFLGVWGGMHLSDGMATLIHKWTSSQSPYIPLISFGIVFVAILAGVFFVAKMVEKFAEKSALSFVNKLLGGAIGALKYVLLLSVLFFVIDAIEKNIEIIPKAMKDKSALYRPVSKVATIIIPGIMNGKLGKMKSDSAMQIQFTLKDSLGK